jgi:NDP-hexose-3-ketoreductase
MTTIKIGVLGCANIADRLVIPAIKALPQYELLAVASRSAGKAEQLASKYACEAIVGYENLVARTDIDAVYIPLPTGMHYHWIKACLTANKHVFCEKSLTENLAQTQEIIALAKQKNLLLMENFMFEYHSQHKFVKNLIEKGEIGEIRCFRSAFGFPPFPDSDNIRYQKSLGGGALLDAAGYTLKAAQLFLGDGLKVQGAFLKYNEEQGVDIYGGAFLVAENKAFAELSWGFDNYYQCNYEIWGSKGKIIATRAFTAKPGFKPTIILEQQGRNEAYEVAADNHFENILSNFYDTIQQGYFDDKYLALLNQSSLLTQVRNNAKS